YTIPPYLLIIKNLGCMIMRSGISLVDLESKFISLGASEETGFSRNLVAAHLAATCSDDTVDMIIESQQKASLKKFMILLSLAAYVPSTNSLQENNLPFVAPVLDNNELKEEKESKESSDSECSDNDDDIYESCDEEDDVLLTPTISTANHNSVNSSVENNSLFSPSVAQPLDLFDALKIGRIIQIDNFNGSCPRMIDMARTMLTYDNEDPSIHHSSCTLETSNVSNDNQKTVRLVAKAEEFNKNDLSRRNLSYGISGKASYELELELSRNDAGDIICTEIRGVSGELVFPKAIDCMNFFKTVVSNNVSDYSTGSGQEIPVNLTRNVNGVFSLIINIDPEKLHLSGMSNVLLSISKKLSLASPAVLKGDVDPYKFHDNNKDNNSEHKSCLRK
ncbi:hypothetical protein N9L02_03645, partial [Gammaproteobacteria bacterium]|nr:hypothetical protein [Gammaproteobacteria bacterium]